MNKKIMDSYTEANDIIKSMNSCGDSISKLQKMVLEKEGGLKNIKFTGKK
jgi:predicted HAD superfamily phosphohydrolase